MWYQSEITIIVKCAQPWSYSPYQICRLQINGVNIFIIQHLYRIMIVYIYFPEAKITFLVSIAWQLASSFDGSNSQRKLHFIICIISSFAHITQMYIYIYNNTTK